MQKIKLLLLAAFLLPLTLFAQKSDTSALVFDKNFYNYENRWVVFPRKPADSVYAYGFIYMDETAGLTFNYEGVFSIDTNGKFLAVPNDLTNVLKVRLQANTSKISILSEAKLVELNLPKEPDWLKLYKRDPASMQSLINRGRNYNDVEAFDIALGYLNKAYAIKPHAEGLEFELAYNYNAQNQFQKAIAVLNPAIKADSKNFWLYRELGYAYAGLKSMEKSEEAYLLAISVSNDVMQKTEMAYNMAYSYFNVGNKEKFRQWVEKTKSFSPSDSPLLKNLEVLAQKLNINSPN